MDSRAKNRLKLSLRAEKAMGLRSIQASSPLPALRGKDREGAADVEQSPSPRPSSGVSGEGVSPSRTVESLFAAPIEAASSLIQLPVLSGAEKAQLLATLDGSEVKGCIKCRLSETRDKTVFGEGDPNAAVCFIGEGPGGNEDATGRPFVGRAGELLNKMIGAMGLRREDVYIANIVKCRAFTPGPPPKDRAPAPDEVAACTPYLERQLEIIRPRVIVTLGLPASRHMLNSNESMGRLRGRWHAWRGVKVMPTYHPAYVLRNYTDQTRAAVWSDLQMVMAELKTPVPGNTVPSLGIPGEG